MLILVASALIGCPPVSQASYGYGYAQPTYYAQQQYAPTYQQTYQAPQAYLQADADYFASKVAEYARKKVLEQQAAQQQQDLLNKVNQLGVIVEKLAAQPPPPPPFQTPQPSPQFQATPQYQAPPVPSKQAPEQPFQAPPPPLAQPPVPSKSSYGPAGPNLAPTTPATPDFNGFQSYAPTGSTSLTGTLAVDLQKCAQCHTGPGSKRGVIIFDSPGVLANLGLDQRLEMMDAVKSGRMPPRSAPDPALAAEILQSIQSDVASVASNNVGNARR